jgi:hypothetical protein
LSKSFTSTAVGLAVAEGRLSIDDKVVDFFPEDLPDRVSPNLDAMRVRHLLSMCTGHAEDTTGSMVDRRDGNWAREFLRRKVTHEPGTHFLYNTGASYMLSAIVQKLTGMGLVDYLRPRLFDPLGIDYADWETCPRGIATGGFGLSVKTEAIARLGQFYLQKGEWEGRQLLPAAWVAEATRSHIDNSPNENIDWEQGYGYQFWRCRHNCYRGDGAFGQYCIVMPEQDAVVAITGGVRDMQLVLDLVWEHLLPAMKAASPLPADAPVQDRLSRRLSSLSLPPLAGGATSPNARRVSGRVFELPENEDGLETIAVELGKEPALVVRADGVDHRVPFAFGAWRRGGRLPMGRARLMGDATYAVAATGAWTHDDTLAVKACFHETPFCASLGLRFAGDALVLDREMNVGFGPTKRAALVGLPRRAATAR